MANNNQIYKMSNAGGFKSLTRYYDMLAGNTTWSPWTPAGTYDALATVTVPSGGAATIEFAGIPSTYKHLQIRCIARGTSTGTTITTTANGDTGANYSRHYLYGDGSTTGAAGSASQTSLVVAYAASNSNAANIFAANFIEILDYANTSKYKTFRSLSGLDINGAGGYIQMNSSLWMSNSAITSLTFTLSNFAQYSSFALYGVK